MNVRELLHAFVDIETTGLEPGRFIKAPTPKYPERLAMVPNYEMTEVGIILTEPGNWDILEEYETKVMPRHPWREEDGAKKVNIYRPQLWRGAPYLEEVAPKIRTLLEGKALIIHTLRFDWSYLYLARIVDIRTIPVVFDTKSIARGLLQNRLEISRFSADEIARALGIPEETKPHTALNGARQAFAIWRRFIAPRNAC